MLDATITFANNKQQLLNAAQISVAQGCITAIVGESGAGKSTLLRCLACLETSWNGSLSVDEIELRPLTPQLRASLIGFVFQEYNLFPHLSVLDNVARPLAMARALPKSQAEEQARTYLQALGIAHLERSLPQQLSGGQKQRVAIARALVFSPKVLLLDEPSAALDPATSQALATLLRELAASGTTIIIASHDMSFVAAVADSVLRLEHGTLAGL